MKLLAAPQKTYKIRVSRGILDQIGKGKWTVTVDGKEIPEEMWPEGIKKYIIKN